MTPVLRLDKPQKPSIFNRDMLIGLFAGALIPSMFIGAIAGALIGGFMGKSRIEKENQHGKDAHPPSFWNKKTVIGGLAGFHVGALIAGAIAISAIAIVGIPIAAIGTVGGVAAMGLTGAQAGTLALAGLASIVSIVGGTVAGTFMGGKVGKTEMTEEYQQALVQQTERERTLANARTKEPGLSVAQDKDISWAEREKIRLANRDLQTVR
jgi:hypothetical protein